MNALRFAPAAPRGSVTRSPSRVSTHHSQARTPRLIPHGWRDDSPLVDDVNASSTKRAKRSGKKKDAGAQRVTGKGKGDASSAKLTKIDLGQGKYVELYVPTDVADVEGKVTPQTLEQFRDSLYGAGDVIWPASVAMSRLITHCPSLIKDKRILEIGAGLGLVGNSALKAGAEQVVMCDYDGDVLNLAKRSAVVNNPVDPSMGKTLHLDWMNISSEFCADSSQKFDVIIAADVLYDEQSVECVANVIHRSIKKGGMCLVCDPEQRQHRNYFADAALEFGLETVEADFPGHENMRLVQVTRVEMEQEEG